jgi:hypothetical protein
MESRSVASNPAFPDTVVKENKAIPLPFRIALAASIGVIVALVAVLSVLMSRSGASGSTAPAAVAVSAAPLSILTVAFDANGTFVSQTLTTKIRCSLATCTGTPLSDIVVASWVDDGNITQLHPFRWAPRVLPGAQRPATRIFFHVITNDDKVEAVKSAVLAFGPTLGLPLLSVSSGRVPLSIPPEFLMTPSVSPRSALPSTLGTVTPSGSATATSSSFISFAPSSTVSASCTSTGSTSPSMTTQPSLFSSSTPSPSASPSSSVSASASPSSSVSASASPSSSVSASVSPSSSASASASLSSSVSASASLSSSVSASASPSPSSNPSKSSRPSPTSLLSATATRTATRTATPTPSVTPSQTPSVTPSASFIPPGTKWTRLAFDMASNSGWYVASSANGMRLAAARWGGPSPGLMRSSDRGFSWSSDSSRSWRCVALSADGMKLVAGVFGGFLGGYLYTSTDAGQTFIQRALSKNWRALSSSADGTVLLAAESTDGSPTCSFKGYGWVSTDSGVSWTGTSPWVSWLAAGVSGDGKFMVLGSCGDTLYLSTNRGTTWSSVVSPTFGSTNNILWTSVALSYNGSVILATHRRSTVLSTDSGATWTAVGGSASGAAVSSDGRRMIFLEGGTTAITSLDGGSSWVSRGYIAGSYSEGKSFLAGSSDGSLLFAGIDAAIYVSP